MSREKVSFKECILEVYKNDALVLHGNVLAFTIHRYVRHPYEEVEIKLILVPQPKYDKLELDSEYMVIIFDEYAGTFLGLTLSKILPNDEENSLTLVFTKRDKV